MTLQQLIVLATPDGVVDMTPPAISARTSIPLDIIEKGLKTLAEPDPYSRSPKDEGRRIVLIDPDRPWGWCLVNHAQYRGLASEADRRAQTRERVARHRERRREQETDCNGGVTLGNASNAIQKHTQDTKAEESTTAAARPSDDLSFDEFQARYPKRAGSQPWPRARKAINARLREGHTWRQILDGTARYAAFCEATGKVGTETVMQAATFCGPDKRFLEPFHVPVGARRGPPVAANFDGKRYEGTPDEDMPDWVKAHG